VTRSISSGGMPAPLAAANAFQSRITLYDSGSARFLAYCLRNRELVGETPAVPCALHADEFVMATLSFSNFLPGDPPLTTVHTVIPFSFDVPFHLFMDSVLSFSGGSDFTSAYINTGRMRAGTFGVYDLSGQALAGATIQETTIPEPAAFGVCSVALCVHVMCPALRRRRNRMSPCRVTPKPV
jgi:hypothetical protein